MSSPLGRIEIALGRPVFRDRADAGRVLARSLGKYAGRSDVVVLGLARGGVPVARRVADVLDAQLGVVVARKITAPGIDEIAVGAIAEGTRRVIADSVARYLGVPPRVIERLASVERTELDRRVELYGAGLASIDVNGRVVVLVDDGLTSVIRLRAAIRAVRERQPSRLVVAVPVASRTSAAEARLEVDELVVVMTPARFETVAACYEHYPRVSDDDVLSLLGRPGRRVSSDIRDITERLSDALTRTESRSTVPERTVAISVDDAILMADLGIPRGTLIGTDSQRAHGIHGLVVLAHGGGSSRNSYRNRYIAGRLRLSGYATLRVDLVSREEQQHENANGSKPFDVDHMAVRLGRVCEWADREGVAGAHRTILIGASLSAAAAFVTAARNPERIFGVVARGGRVDLAAHVFPRVVTPALLIVGGADAESLRQNADALESLPRGAVLIRVPRAGQAFAQPGTLGMVAEEIVSWLDRLQVVRRQERRWHA